MTKKERFEIFKRDGFTCRYCGRRPPEVVLEVDHIDPRANGGSNDPINLITSCFDCNRGKADRPLSDIRPRPDADLAYLELQQEMMEAKRYLDASQMKREMEKAIQARLEDVWSDQFSLDYVPADRQWRSWLRLFSPEEIEYAIKATTPFNNQSRPSIHRLIQYVSKILWNRRNGAGQTTSEPAPDPPPTQLTQWPHNRNARTIQ